MSALPTIDYTTIAIVSIVSSFFAAFGAEFAKAVISRVKKTNIIPNFSKQTLIKCSHLGVEVPIVDGSCKYSNKQLKICEGCGIYSSF